MKKFFIPRMVNVLSHNERGRGAELIINRDLFKDDPEKFDDALMRRYDDFVKLNKLDQTVMFNYPKLHKRLSERRRPCEVRRQKEEDERRAIDRNIANGFCNWFMWSRAAYKPPTSNGKKKK